MVYILQEIVCNQSLRNVYRYDEDDPIKPKWSKVQPRNFGFSYKGIKSRILANIFAKLSKFLLKREFKNEFLLWLQISLVTLISITNTYLIEIE